MKEANNDTAARSDELTPASAGVVAATDPALYEDLVYPWELCHTPMERGAFGYRMRYLKTPGMLLYQERFDLRGRVRGLLPSGIFAFAVPIRLGSRSAYWGAPVQRAGLPAMRGGGLDAVLDSGQDQLLVLAKASLIRSHFPARVAEALERCADTRLLPAEEQDIALFGDWLFGLIHNGLNQPEVLQYGGGGKCNRGRSSSALGRCSPGPPSRWKEADDVEASCGN